MKSILYFITLYLIVPININSQQLLFETGKSITSFDYHDSRTNTIANLQSSNNTFMSFGFRHKAIEKFLFVSLGINYNTYGAIGSDDSLGNFMEWESTHLGLYVGLDFKVWHLKKMNFYLKGTLSPEFIIQGTQTFNNQVFDLVDADDFDKTIFFFRGGIFATYPITDQTDFYIQYMGGKSKSLRNAATLPDQEKLRFISHNLGFGIILNLHKTQE